MDKTHIKYIRLDDHENAIVQAVAEQHGTSLAAAIRFIIRDWKRLVDSANGKDAPNEKV